MSDLIVEIPLDYISLHLESVPEMFLLRRLKKDWATANRVV